MTDEKIKCLKENLPKLDGIQGVTIVKERNKVYVDSVSPTFLVHQEIERLSNTLAVLRGMGTINDSAVAEILSEENDSKHNVRGVIRLVQIDDQNCAIDGTIDGLGTGPHALICHEYGDLSNGFKKYHWKKTIYFKLV